MTTRPSVSNRASQPAVSSTRPSILNRTRTSTSSRIKTNNGQPSVRTDRSRGIGSIIGKKEPSVPAKKKQSAANQRSLTEKSGSRIGRTIGERSVTDRSAEKVAGIRNPKAATRGTIGSAADRTIGRPAGLDTRTGRKDLSLRDTSISPLRDSSTKTGIRLPQDRLRTTVAGGHTAVSLRTTTTSLHHYDTLRPSRVLYYDRPHLIRDSYHHDYVYRDYYDRIRSRTIWPRFRFAVHYDCGPRFTFRYVYPYYHRKYMFISLGGYWPLGYRYTRYYWYGCHPYNWYGYYPIAREVRSPSYNYYTYNYYTEGDGGYQPAQTIVNSEIFENLAEQTAEPQEATLADVYFEEAVKAFEVAQYNTAAMKFAKAMELAPEDMILPFAYAQALIGSQQYSKAAEVLRGALVKVSPEKEGVFFPRGLYPNEESLLKHIDRLAERAAQFSFDADLQLLLGYQLLGIGQYDRAVEPLMNAGRDLENAKAAAVLMHLLEKIKTNNKPETSAPAESPAPAPLKAPAPIQTPAPLQTPVPAPGKAIVPSPAPAPAASKASIQDRSRTLGGAMLVTSLCALGTSFGIGHFARG